MKIKLPPELELMPIVSAIQDTENYDGYMAHYAPLDTKGRYLAYDELRHRIDPPLKHRVVWSLIKEARKRQRVEVIELGEPSQQCHYLLTPLIQKAVSEVDRNTTSAQLEWISSQIGERSQMQYLLKDLIEDESISSSQLEGAATTTKAAKELLKRNKKPRSNDEKMIIGNYKMMLFAWENRHKDLSLDFLCEMHKVGVEGINDDHYDPGSFRRTSDVQVVDSEGSVVHIPPPYETLKARLGEIINWANTDHASREDASYLHPFIKAVILHFCIGYEHPFRDGNGRVARTLFYWYLFKNDFSAFRYIAISLLLKKAPVKYGKSYLYTETDEMDLTYFIEYQSDIVIRAIDKFKKSYKDTALEIERFNDWLFRSGLYGKLTDKQRIVFQVAKSGLADFFTVRDVERNLGCSYNTAATTLNGLVALNIFKKVKEGREWHYRMFEQQEIIANWKAG